MALTGYIFETRGGRIIARFEPSEASWQHAGNPAETVDVTIPLYAVSETRRGWRNLASEWNHCIALDVGGRYVGGPILPHDFDNDKGTLKLTARGIRVLLERQYILPVSALTTSLVDGAGKPRTSMDTFIANVDYGTIGKRIMQQLMTWPSWGDVPIVFHADRAGKRFATYSALDLENVDAALSDLSELENGPDIRFDLERVGDSFRWRYRSGTEDAPRLQGGAEHTWTLNRTSQLRVKTIPTHMASVAWSIAGKSSDETLVAMLYDPTVVNLGGMLMHTTTSISPNETDPLAARRWNVEALRTSQRPWEFWTFRVSATEQPRPLEYAPGDLVKVVIPEGLKVSGGYVQAGTYSRRIAALSGSEDSAWIDITCGEFYG